MNKKGIVGTAMLIGAVVVGVLIAKYVQDKIDSRA